VRERIKKGGFIMNYKHKNFTSSPSHRKESNLDSGFVIVALDNEPRDFITVRFYKTSKTVYCCFWLNSEYGRFSFYLASGKASGYGFDNKRGAFENALSNAGFSGHWNLSTDDIIKYICDDCGVKKYYKVDFHG
jgi:hypothetical protein